MSVDERSWHVLALDEEGEVVACLRYLEESHAASFEDLWVRQAALARCPTRGPRFRRAVERTMEWTRRVPMGFGEVGGWAVAENHRGAESLRIVLATYALLEHLGSCAGVATATFRHGAATMLRKIGLTGLLAEGEELAPYYDLRYDCEMQVLQFDSRSPNPKYRKWILELGATLSSAPVVCRESLATSFERVWQTFDQPSRVQPMAEAWVSRQGAIDGVLAL